MHFLRFYLRIFCQKTPLAYIQLCFIHTINEIDIMHYPIFYNHEILIENKSVFFNSWFKAGISYISDLLDENNDFLSYNDFCFRFSIKANFLHYQGMIYAIKTFLKKKKYTLHLHRLVETPFIPPYILCLVKDKTGVKSIYNSLNKNKDKPTCITSLKEKIGLELSPADWGNVFNLPFKINRDSKLQWFQ